MAVEPLPFVPAMCMTLRLSRSDAWSQTNDLTISADRDVDSGEEVFRLADVRRRRDVADLARQLYGDRVALQLVERRDRALMQSVNALR